MYRVALIISVGLLACAPGTVGLGDGTTVCAEGSCNNSASTCGDGSCDSDETCSSCAADCGSCGASCGDGTCDAGETCANCASDCGTCSATCGDNSCGGSETCGTCAADCGSCGAACGDSTCDVSESCSSCANDCGSCGGFPLPYSVSRPLLANTPGALLAGADWQGVTQQGLVPYEFNADPYSGGLVDASTTNTVNVPGSKRAEVVGDPVFGNVVRCWHTDGSDGLDTSVHFMARWSGVNKAWYRYTIKYQNGFHNRGDPTSWASAWKVMFSSNQRHHEIVGSSYFDYGVPTGTYGGTETYLPGSPTTTGYWADVQGEWTDQQWYEYIVYEERLSQTEYRVRRWIRRISNNDVIIDNPPVRDRTGFRLSGGNIPAGAANYIKLGINRNKTMFSGEAQWWKWGPWEVIDGDVLSDPYGLAADML